MELKVEFSKLGSLVLREPITLDLKRAILYGRNSIGKSLIIKATIAGLAIHEDVKSFLLPGLHDLKRLLKTSDFKVTVRTDKQILKIARVTAGTARIVTEVDDERRKYKINVGAQWDLQLMLSDPEFAEKLNDFFSYYYLDVKVYGGFYRDQSGEWIKIANLPYSYRRIIAILYALEKSDLVFIEAFSSGLHMSMQKYLIDHISEEYKDKVIVIETHHTPAIVFGSGRNWITYYVERDKITKLEKYEDLVKVDVFFRELQEVMIP
jgi:predicted ATPase